MPYFGWLQMVAGSIAVGRSGDIEAAKRSLAVGEERSKEGYMVSGFPEGTRRRSPSCGREQIQVLKKGMFHLAKNVAQEDGGKYYIVPMVMMGGNAAWPAKRALPVPGAQITVRIGDPVPVDCSESVDETSLRIRKAMQDELEIAGAVKGDQYSAESAFQNGTEINLWKAYGFEAVMMLVPSVATLFLAYTGKL